MRFTVVLLVVLAVTALACPAPGDGARACNTNDDCLVVAPVCTGGICVAADDGEGEGAEGEGDGGEGEGAEGEGDVAGEGEGDAGEGEGDAGEGEGEGEGEGGAVSLAAPAAVPILLPFTVVVTGDAPCTLTVDGLAEPADPGASLQLVLDDVGAHLVQADCANGTFAQHIDAWTIEDASIQTLVSFGDGAQLDFTVAGIDASALTCEAVVTSTQPFAPRPQSVAPVSAGGDLLVVDEGSDVELRCTGDDTAPALVVPVGHVQVRPTAPQLTQSISADDGGTLFIEAHSEGASECLLVEQSSGATVDTAVRGASTQTDFTVSLARAALPAPSDLTLVVACDGAPTAALSETVLVHAGDVTDPDGVAALQANGTQVLLGLIQLADPPSLTLPALQRVTPGPIAVDCLGDAGGMDVQLASLVDAGGDLSFASCALSGLHLDSLLDVGGLTITGSVLNVLALPRLTVMNGAGGLHLEFDSLQTLSFPSLLVVNGPIRIRGDTLSCAQIVPIICQLDPNPPAQNLTLTDSSFATCDVDASCVQ